MLRTITTHISGYSLQVTGHDLRTMCELLPRVPDDVQVLLLRSIAGLASFQERYNASTYMCAHTNL